MFTSVAFLRREGGGKWRWGYATYPPTSPFTATPTDGAVFDRLVSQRDSVDDSDNNTVAIAAGSAAAFVAVSIAVLALFARKTSTRRRQSGAIDGDMEMDLESGGDGSQLASKSRGLSDQDGLAAERSNSPADGDGDDDEPVEVRGAPNLLTGQVDRAILGAARRLEALNAKKRGRGRSRSARSGAPSASGLAGKDVYQDDKEWDSATPLSIRDELNRTGSDAFAGVRLRGRAPPRRRRRRRRRGRRRGK